MYVCISHRAVFLSPGCFLTTFPGVTVGYESSIRGSLSFRSVSFVFSEIDTLKRYTLEERWFFLTLGFKLFSCCFFSLVLNVGFSPTFNAGDTASTQASERNPFGGAKLHCLTPLLGLPVLPYSCSNPAENYVPGRKVSVLSPTSLGAEIAVESYCS